MTSRTPGICPHLIAERERDSLRQLHGPAAPLHDQVGAGTSVQIEKRTFERLGHADQCDHRGDGNRQAAGRQRGARGTPPEILSGNGPSVHSHRPRQTHESCSRPSRIQSVRCARAATWASCVMTTSVKPRSRCNRSNNSSTLIPGDRIQIAGRLIGQQQLRIVGQRPRDRHALSLAHRKLGRQMSGAMRHPNQVQQLGRLFRALLRAERCLEHRDLNILERRQRRQQIERLKDKSQRGATESGPGRSGD